MKMKEIIYPTEELIIQYKELAITIFEVKKTDKAKLLSIQNCQKQ